MVKLLSKLSFSLAQSISDACHRMKALFSQYCSECCEAVLQVSNEVCSVFSCYERWCLYNLVAATLL